MYKELTIKQDGKNISLCFMNNETFKKETENKTETEMLEFANSIYESALKVLQDSNKRYGILKRQMAKMDKESVMFKVAERKLEATNNTIENLQGALQALEEGKEEFHWIKYMIEKCIGNGEEEEEEE